MQEQQIAAFADDRCTWRNLVVACSAADGWWWWKDITPGILLITYWFGQEKAWFTAIIKEKLLNQFGNTKLSLVQPGLITEVKFKYELPAIVSP